MRVYNHKFHDLYKKGLRPLEDVDYNGKFLTLAQNVKPSPAGLIDIEKYVRSFVLNEDAQIFVTYKEIYVLTSTQIYKVSGSSLISVSTTTTAGGLWSCADFREYIVFTNGLVTAIRNITTGVFAFDAGTILPISGCCCNYRGILMLGALTNYPASGTYSNWVAWSDVGDASFLDPTGATKLNIARKNLAGYIPMPWKGTIWHVIPLDKNVIVYGDNGITVLYHTQVDPVAAGTFGIKHLSDMGIMNKGAVVSNGKEDAGSIHYFIDKAGWFCMIDNNLEIKRLGYKEYMA